jgi:GDP-D-mannose dehydratase
VKTALITGITGQDGSFLAEFLHVDDFTSHASGRRALIGIEAGIRKTYEWHPAHAELAANR